MLRTRLWMGALLIALTGGALLVDRWLAPWYPFLFIIVVALAALAAYELRELLAPELRPPMGLTLTSVLAIILANWARPVAEVWGRDIDPWRWIAGLLAAVVVVAFLWEMAIFRQPGKSIERIAMATWIACYLGLLPCFLIQLRWRSALTSGGNLGSLALAMAIFVPKMCDTGAYFTGRFLGRHPLAPILSPKKTWEGAIGGLGAAMLATILLNRWGRILPDIGSELGFGLVVGIAAMLGDLAESLIKRDGGRKDASQVVPGFGGVLDIIDSILFAAPVAYCWLAL